MAHKKRPAYSDMVRKYWDHYSKPDGLDPKAHQSHRAAKPTEVVPATLFSPGSIPID